LNYIYGIDPAQSLNYTGIVVTQIENKKVYITTLRKFQKLTYPELEEILLNDLFKRFPPRLVVVDYTNEKAFSETMEAKLNPSFMNQNSLDYKRWKTVKPVVFTQETKLMLKQNAKEMFEKKQFVWPNQSKSDPRMWSLVEELKGQMMREAASPGRNGLLQFLKPEGYDNDLIIAHELNLYGAKEFLYNDPDDWYIRRPNRGNNPMEQYACNSCKQGNHHNNGIPVYVYYEATGGQIECPCSLCKI
jgi:hypothetical protein